LNDSGKPGNLGATTTKEKVIEVMRDLPANASIEDAMERLLLMAKVEKGLEQADSGQVIPYDRVKEKVAKWLK
jgi:predicted transcriptional regulator